MADSDNLPVRMSVRELMKEENSSKRNSLLRAWKRISELPPENPNSFYQIAGFHGEPFVKSQVESIPEGDPYWGGYCQHQNVLFPFWHRLYLLRLEQALQTVDPDAMIPYWDQTSQESLENGVPKLLTDEMVEIDGKQVENPLKSFVLKKALAGDNSKPVDYETVRYPYAGLSGPDDIDNTNKHNDKVNESMIADETTPTCQLNQQICWWLQKSGTELYGEKRDAEYGIEASYKQCLQSPNYNEFSNTSTSKVYLKGYDMVSLEYPHNWMHLAVGGASFKLGYNYPGFMNGASGDMMFNETAGFDPIFYFHHCNIDRLLWVWQKQHGMTDELEINDYQDDPGVIPIKGQGPTPYQHSSQDPKISGLTLDTPLHPFQQLNGLPNTSRNAINIEKQLKYKYSKGSLDEDRQRQANIKYVLKEQEGREAENEFLDDLTEEKANMQITSFLSRRKVFQASRRIIPSYVFVDTVVTVSNINKDDYAGSFVVHLYWNSPTDGKIQIGTDVFLNRINRKVCGNCQQRPNFVTASFNITKYGMDIEKEDLSLKIDSYGPSGAQGVLGKEDVEGMEISIYRVYKPTSIL